MQCHLKAFRQEMERLVLQKDMLIPFLLQNTVLEDQNDFIQNIVEAHKFKKFINLGDIKE